MNNRLGSIKTTVLGGFVFLIPAVIVVVALGKVIGILNILAKALLPLFGIDSLAAGLVLDLLGITLTVLLCFVAGLNATRMRERLDTTLLNSFPDTPSLKDSLRTSCRRNSSREASTGKHYAIFAHWVRDPSRSLAKKKKSELRNVPEKWHACER